MAGGFYDDGFVLENGIITNQNVPLILEHDLEDDQNVPLIPEHDLEDEEELDYFPDFVAGDNQAFDDDVAPPHQAMFQGGGNVQGFAPIEMPQNGFNISSSSSSSSGQSAPIVDEQGNVVDTSSSPPTRDLEAGCYVNECYQSSGTSELSEFTPSVEVEPGTHTVSFKGSSSKVTDSVEDNNKTLSTSGRNKNKETQTTPTRNTSEAFTSTLDDDRDFLPPNPPNSPATSARSGRSSNLLRRNRNRTNPEVQQLNSPDRPSNFFRKFGKCLLLLVLVLLLAMVACLEGLFPRSSLTLIAILWVLAIIGAAGCFIKACWEERGLAAEVQEPRRSYGATSAGNGLAGTTT